jgi:twinkle protein
MWEAKIYTPDGIISGKDTWEQLIASNDKECIPYCWDGLNSKTLGLRRGEIVTFTAGTGQGKSQVCREIAHHLILQNEKVGYIALEENVQRSIRGIVSIGLSKPIHLPEVRKEIPEKDMKEAWSSIKDNCYFYDHWGSIDSDNLLNRIKYLAHACGCHWIILDHLSIVISGNENSDERRLIDNTMTKLRSLVEELNIGILLVSHLRRLEGNRDHTDGAITSLAHLRGSAAIAQLSDIVVGLERNQQSQDNPDRVTVRVLKNRFSGDTGIATYLNYNKDTGRLTEEGYTSQGGLNGNNSY